MCNILKITSHRVVEKKQITDQKLSYNIPRAQDTSCRLKAGTFICAMTRAAMDNTTSNSVTTNTT